MGLTYRWLGLHTRRTDVKPANLLLKSNPSDYRGFTVKLADFGFVLHLNEVRRRAVQHGGLSAYDPAYDGHLAFAASITKHNTLRGPKCTMLQHALRRCLFLCTRRRERTAVASPTSTRLAARESPTAAASAARQCAYVCRLQLGFYRITR